MQIEFAERAASEFMRHKGYGRARPDRVETVDGQDDIWYFFYELHEGTLELEVEWTGEKWSWDVMDFIHREGTLASSGR